MSSNSNNGNADVKARAIYVTTFRDGAIGANVFLNQGPQGLLYLNYKCSRSYRQQNGKTGYRSDFFDYNHAAIVKASKEASAFIQKFKINPEAALVEGKQLNDQKKERAREAQVAPPKNGVTLEADGIPF